MCLICIEIQKGKLQPNDFIRNFGEIKMTDPKHAEEINNNFQKEIEELLEDPYDYFWGYRTDGDKP